MRFISQGESTPVTRMLLPGLVLVLALALAACNGTPPAVVSVETLPAGNAAAGRAALRTYGCSSCHHIPGVAGADSYVAPPLDGWAERSYIAGTLPNEPAHLIRWIRFPQAVEPGTAMPNLQVSAEDAAHMSAYLYTLRSRPTWVEKVARALR